MQEDPFGKRWEVQHSLCHTRSLLWCFKSAHSTATSHQHIPRGVKGLYIKISTIAMVTTTEISHISIDCLMLDEWLCMATTSGSTCSSLFPPTTLFIYWLLCPGQQCQPVKGLYRGRDGSWPDPSATSVIIALRTYCPVHAGNIYLERVGSSRQKIAKLGNPFIRDGTVSHSTMDQTLYTCTHTHMHCMSQHAYLRMAVYNCLECLTIVNVLFIFTDIYVCTYVVQLFIYVPYYSKSDK